MDKKAESEITVLELVGERNFLCHYSGFNTLQCLDLERLNFLISQMNLALITEPGQNLTEFHKRISLIGDVILNSHPSLEVEVNKKTDDIIKFMKILIHFLVGKKLAFTILNISEKDKTQKNLTKDYSNLIEDISLLVIPKRI